MSASKFVRIAAAVMFIGVGLGAIGAHGFEKILEQNGRVETWDTAVKYHLVHGLALLALAFSGRRSPVAFWAWIAGIVAFSGGLYVYSLADIRQFGMIAAPIGGVLFLVGWGGLIFKPGEARD